MARKFFHVCAGMFLLALAYHIGANTALAQAPGNSVVGIAGSDVVTANGDVYVIAGIPGGTSTYSRWVLAGNVFTGGPTPALHESWGQVKARYRATPGTTVTPGANSQ